MEGVKRTMGKFTGKNLMEGLLLVVAITALVLSIIAMTKKCAEPFAKPCYCGQNQDNLCWMSPLCTPGSCAKSCKGEHGGTINNPICIDTGSDGCGGGGGGRDYPCNDPDVDCSMCEMCNPDDASKSCVNPREIPYAKYGLPHGADCVDGCDEKPCNSMGDGDPYPQRCCDHDLFCNSAGYCEKKPSS